MPDDDRYGLTELADLAGVTPRTVRYYLSQGLLPSVGQTGPGSKYDDGHLARLRLIRRLQAEHLPLAEIRRRIDGLGDDEIIGLTRGDDAPPPAGSALDYLRSVLGAAAGGRKPSPPSLPGRVLPPIRVSSPGSKAWTIAPNSVAERLDKPYGATTAATEVPPAAQPIERSQWERIVLAPDVELNIRRPLARAQQKQVDRLVTIARELLEEDRP